MAVTITTRGNAENILAQIRAEASLASDYNGNTHRAIEYAATEAAVVLTQGSDLNMLEQLAGAAAVVLPFTLVAAQGAPAIVGPQVTVGTTSQLAKSVGAVTGKKALIVRIDGVTPAVGSEFTIGFGNAVGSKRVMLAINGAGIAAANVDPAGSAAQVWTHTTGNIYAIYRDDATGAWGVVLPNGTDSGNLSGSIGGFTGEAAFALIGSAGNAPGVLTLLNAGGPALPAGYTIQQFA